MTLIEFGLISVIAIVVMVYHGVYIPIALGAVSFVAIWVIRDNFDLAMSLMKLAVSDSMTEYGFAAVPLFTFMGLVVSKARLGSDIYDVISYGFRKISGGIGMATVGANAVFAAVTGSSLASASVFSKVAVPQMLALGYNPKFAVGVVAGSSVLGMIIPPSAMLIIYSFVAEQSVGHMFLAGIVPGLMLAAAYIAAIFVAGRIVPNHIGGRTADEFEAMSWMEIADKALPTLALIFIVLGGIYTGWMTAVEAGAAGALTGLVIAIARRSMQLSDFWDALLETGRITASILFLITAASIYSRMLGIAGLPNQLGDILANTQADFVTVMVIYVLLMIFLGTILDTTSIILIVVPMFLPLVEPMGLNLIWFGIVTVVGAEIGLLTPPLGISCFVIKATLNDDRIPLKTVFLGALPFAFIMLLVLIVLIAFPGLSLVFL